MHHDTDYPTTAGWLEAEQPGTTPRLSDFERVRQLLQPCDVLLVDGRRRVDRRISGITTSRWSHVALYLGRLREISDPALRATVAEYFPCEPDTQLILHTTPRRGLCLDALSELQEEHLRICRPRGMKGDDAQTVIRYAISRLAVVMRLSVLDALCLVLPWALVPRRWRAGLFARLAGRMLRALTGSPIGEAFSFIQFPVLPLVKRTEIDISRLYRRHPRLFYPADFDHSPYFDIVKYPFVDHNDDRNIRLLPWKGSLGALDEHSARQAEEQVRRDGQAAQQPPGEAPRN